ncbi:MAG: Trp biosynthesis-associated membrane protein [Rhodoglobus sp.]
MTGRRIRGLLVTVSAVLGCVVLLTWTQRWVAVTIVTGQVLPITGQAAAPVFSALGLVCLALSAALAITGHAVRVALGIVEAIIGMSVVAVAVSVLGAPLTVAGPTITSATAISGSQSLASLVTSTSVEVWPWVALAAGLLIIAVGFFVMLSSPRWPRPGTRYDNGSVLPGADDASSTLGAWDSLSRGADPTTR